MSSPAEYLHQFFGLEGKTAIVTGATGGLGQSMAMAFVKAGASLVSLELPDDRGSAALAAAVKDAGGSIKVFHCNVANGADIRATYAKIWEAGIVPDILLNCAGVSIRTPCEDATDEQIDLMYNLNAKGSYISCQEFGRRLLALGRPGKIINIASITAFLANKNISVYAGTKGAVLQMTKAFSNEWASKGIQVNCIAPGYMRTPLTDLYANDPEANSYLMGRTPAGRWGKPQDLDSAALFLAAPANTFTTGTCITVDGGWCGK